MSRSRLIPVSLASLLLGILCLGFVLGAGAGKDSIYRYLNVFAEVYSLVKGYYVDPVEDDSLLDGAYRGMVGGLDSFSGYLPKDEFQRFRSDLSGGPATTGIEALRVPGGALVVAVAAGSPAEKAGVRPADQIWSIEGVSTRQMCLAQVRRGLRGAEDSVVRLLIYHPKTQKREDLRLRRALPSGAPFESRLADGKIGYVRIRDLQRTEKDALKSALASLKQKGAVKLLLDLRGCATGGVDDSVKLAGLFLPSGPVVSIQERDGKKVVRETKASPAWTLPVYVLGNSGSAGGAEVLAAALRARLKSTLIGESTYGLGSTQELVALPAGDGLVLSSTKLVSPGGEMWNKTGLKPDKEIPATLDERSGLEPDAQLQKALDVARGLAQAAPPAKAA